MPTASAIVERWARETERRLRAVLREAAQDVAENVSVGGAHSPGTPVDTGFARAQWQATLGETTPVAVDPPAGLQEGALASAGEAAASEMNLVCGAAEITDVISLTNGSRYLPYLEDGSTEPRTERVAKDGTVTPLPYHSGWIAETVHAWPTIVQRATGRVKRAFGA